MAKHKKQTAFDAVIQFLSGGDPDIAADARSSLGASLERQRIRWDRYAIIGVTGDRDPGSFAMTSARARGVQDAALRMDQAGAEEVVIVDLPGMRRRRK